MTGIAEQVYSDALNLPLELRADLTDRLIESLERDAPPEIVRAQIEEVRRRIAQVESGHVSLIPGDEALGQIRKLLESHPPKSAS